MVGERSQAILLRDFQMNCLVMNLIKWFIVIFNKASLSIMRNYSAFSLQLFCSHPKYPVISLLNLLWSWTDLLWISGTARKFGKKKVRNKIYDFFKSCQAQKPDIDDKSDVSVFDPNFPTFYYLSCWCLVFIVHDGHLYFRVCE